jgi:hypothetical protein
MSGANERGTDGVNAPLVGPAPPAPIPGVDLAKQAALLLQPSLDEIHKDIREIRDHGRTEFWRLLAGFAAGFIILAGMVIGVYRWISDDLVRTTTRLEMRLEKQADQLQTINGTLSRVDQKLEDLTKPPTPLPRRP